MAEIVSAGIFRILWKWNTRKSLEIDNGAEVERGRRVEAQ